MDHTKAMISCDLHDYIEIACMYHFSIELTLKNGECVSGVADTVVIKQEVIKQEVIRQEVIRKKVTAKEKQECIWLVDENKNPILVPLSTLASMHAITPNSHFDMITFNEK